MLALEVIAEALVRVAIPTMGANGKIGVVLAGI
jgi:hypothetical protein